MESVTPVAIEFPLAGNFTLPIANQSQANENEAAVSAMLCNVLASLLGSQIADIRDYGSPAIASRNVLERASKQTGLAVLIRDPTDVDYATTTAVMRAVYTSYLALGSPRGLSFLQFLLQMLWPGLWTIVRVWHLTAYANQYPNFLTITPYGAYPYPDFFLTSRIQITLDPSVPLTELSELAPTLRRLVPANVVPAVVVPVPVDDLDVGIGLAMYGTMVADLSPYA